jgi:FkbM family methyltransferase
MKNAYGEPAVCYGFTSPFHLGRHLAGGIFTGIISPTKGPLFMDAYGLLHRTARETLRRAGFTLRRDCPATHDGMSLATMLRKHNVDTVLDVGANRGQFAEEILQHGYNGTVVSYEPLSRPRSILLRKSEKHPRWTIAEPFCLGDATGEVDVQVAENEVASSILDATATMKAYDHSFRYVRKERVPVRRLDDVAPDCSSPFLKVDVQGFEESVLRGATETLKKSVGLSIELSFVPIYQGQMLHREMMKWIEDMGFIPHRLAASFIDVTDGRWLQADAVFFRPDSTASASVS